MILNLAPNKYPNLQKNWTETKQFQTIDANKASNSISKNELKRTEFENKTSKQNKI